MLAPSRRAPLQLRSRSRAAAPAKYAITSASASSTHADSSQSVTWTCRCRVRVAFGKFEVHSAQDAWTSISAVLGGRSAGPPGVPGWPSTLLRSRRWILAFLSGTRGRLVEASDSVQPSGAWKPADHAAKRSTSHKRGLLRSRPDRVALRLCRVQNPCPCGQSRTVGSRRVLRLHELPSCNHPRPRKIQLARDHLWVRTHQPGSVQLHEYHLRVDL